METCGQHAVVTQGERLESDVDNEGVKHMPVNPCSFNAFTVLRTCSIHGLKQQILVVRSFYKQVNYSITETSIREQHKCGFDAHVTLIWRVVPPPMEPEDLGILECEECCQRIWFRND